MSKKLCVLFPGIGYHCDKPLLYYTGKLAKKHGYDVIPLKYSGFTESCDAAAHALALSEEQLSEVGFSGFDRVVFVGKSIGTAASLAYREKYKVNAAAVLLTPLEITFKSPALDSEAFHGTADQWAQTPVIERLCAENSVPLHKYAGANHSLETGDPSADISVLAEVVSILEAGVFSR